MLVPRIVNACKKKGGLIWEESFSHLQEKARAYLGGEPFSLARKGEGLWEESLSHLYCRADHNPDRQCPAIGTDIGYSSGAPNKGAVEERGGRHHADLAEYVW